MGEPKIQVQFCLSFIILHINQPNFEGRIDHTPHFLSNPNFMNFVRYSTGKTSISIKSNGHPDKKMNRHLMICCKCAINSNAHVKKSCNRRGQVLCLPTGNSNHKSGQPQGLPLQKSTKCGDRGTPLCLSFYMSQIEKYDSRL